MGELWVPPGTQRPGQPTGDDSELEVDDFLDSEILQIEQVLNRLNAKYANQIRSRDDFGREAIERFAEIGFQVDILWQQNLSGPAGEYMVPTVRFLKRVKPKPFDHERQRWEVQHDILGVDPNPGALQRDGSVRSPSKSTAFINPAE